MNYKGALFFIITIILPFTTKAQYQEHLQTLIDAEESTEIKQQQLDQFFSENASTMTDMELAECYHQYALQWYYRQRWDKEGKMEFLEKSIQFFKRSADIKRDNDELNGYPLKRSLYNLGAIYKSQSQSFEAIDAFTEIINIEEVDGRTIISYRELANIYSIIGDFHKAIDNSTKMIALSGKDQLMQHRLVEGYINRADIYSLMGYKEYSDEIQKDLQRADSILKIATIDDASYFADAINQTEGNRLLETGHYKESVPYFKQLLSVLDPQDSINLAVVHNSLGQAYAKQKQWEKAFTNLEQSIRFDRNYTLPYENLGDVYIDRKDFPKALSYYQQAIQYSIVIDAKVNYTDSINETDLELASNKYYLLHHLIQKANGWKLYYQESKNIEHLDQALHTFKMADQLIDIIRFESTEYRSKLFWRERGNALYMEAVEACYWLNKPTEAYYFMEKNKALLLLEDLTNEQAKENANIPQHIIEIEYALKKEIYLGENELNLSYETAGINTQALKDKIFGYKQRYEVFVDSLTKVFPEYAANKQKIKVLPYQQLKSAYTSPKEAVIQYIINENKGYGLLTTSQESSLFEIGAVDSLQRGILDWRQQVSQWFAEQQQLENYTSTSHAIFKKLLPQQVYMAIKNKKVIIVPDYTLQQLSFESLNTSGNSHSYLIEDVEIVYAYSMSYLYQNSAIARQPTRGLMSLAPVTFNQQSLSELTRSENEVNAISSLFSGDILLGEQATKANFLDTLNEYKIIHLSTHADIGETSNPWVAFRDQKVSLNEIYATKNQSDMVVLSACNTSLGALKKGEGVMSLARGFFYSGTKSVVSAVWSVNDKANQELMIDFYRGLKDGHTKSTALRNAKLNYIKTHHGSELSPFYWASLVLIGDNSSVSPDSHTPWNWLWAVLPLPLLLFGFLFYKKSSR